MHGIYFEETEEGYIATEIHDACSKCQYHLNILAGLTAALMNDQVDRVLLESEVEGEAVE